MATEFLSFLKSSPSPFHTIASIKKLLCLNSFNQLFESDKWSLNSGNYFFTRNDSAIIAFKIGQDYKHGDAVSIIGTHSDSPCLKLKPNFEVNSNGYKQIGVRLFFL